MTIKTYDDAIKFLESFIDYEKIFGSYYTPEREKLASIRALLDRIGNPHIDLNCVHIAGTKGKGSTAAMTASIFSAAGLKTGLYTSPHLIDFRERIQINGQMISKEACVRHVEGIREAAIAVRDDPAISELSFFEVYTTLAFHYFKHEACDMVVLETGLGGRLDATNVITPLACAITLIGHDHQAILGDTLEEIAVEKAGILKKDVPAIIAPQETSVREVIAKEAKQRGAPVYWVSQGEVKGSCGSQVVVEYLSVQNTFSVDGILHAYPRLEMKLLGRHQMVNAATAIGLAELATRYRFPLPVEAVENGIKQVYWPGRFQIVEKNPTVVLDGAHNPESAVVLRKTLEEYIQYEKLTIVFGGMGDHNLRAVAETLFPLADEVILTRTQNPRATMPDVLKKMTEDLCKRSDVAANATEAMELARRSVGPQDAILVTGSLYLVGDVLSLINKPS